MSFDRARLAAQLQQFVFLAARARHLVHDAAGRTDGVVFDALAQRRQVGRVDALVEARGDGGSNRDLQRGRRRDASAFRYRGVNQDP